MNERIATASVTRPTDTTTYAANDVIAAATAATLQFKFGAVDPGSIVNLKSAILIDSANETTKPDIDLLLFSADQTDLDADNVAYSPTDAQALTLVAVVSFAGSTFKSLQAGAGGNGAIQVVNINQLIPLDQLSKVYGVLVARNAYVPINAEVFTISLGIED